MRKLLLIAITLIFTISHSDAASDWRMHPTFDDKIEHLIETSKYVYFTSMVLPVMTDRDTYRSLFRYYKDGEELQVLSTDNILSYNTVQTIQYNPEKKYVVVVYSDYNIDFLYDDGKVVSLPTYKLASIGARKNVNSITIDPTNDRIYLATNFGYLAINDKKHEIAESRVYGEPLKSVARLGDELILIHENDILAAPVSEPRMSLEDYRTIKTMEEPLSLHPLTDKQIILLAKDGSPHNLYKIEPGVEDIEIVFFEKGNFYNIENNSRGITVPTGSKLYEIRADGEVRSYSRLSEDINISVSSYNLNDIWYGERRLGIKSAKLPAKSASGKWETTRDYILPNSPAPFLATEIITHPTKGMLVCNYGSSTDFSQFSQSVTMQLSGYKNGEWTNYGPAYTNPAYAKIMTSPNGFAIDPDNSNLIYLTSRHNGILRINLESPDDFLHLSAATDDGATMPGFVEFIPANRYGYCNFSAPRFDSYGNMWTSYTDSENKDRLRIFCWTAADRKASTNSSNVILPKEIQVPGYTSTNLDYLFPLKTNGHKNWLIQSNGNYEGHILVIDTNGTPTDSSDDKIGYLKEYIDQDGNQVAAPYIRCFWEDPTTGNVWVGHDNGVFYFNPADILSGSNRVYRIKVSRNDGTNLADYLLNGVAVHQIVTDASGNKWFATGGGGLICTSSDGREIISEITSSNSDLPDDLIYGLAYNASNNSLLMSTAQGIAEYFLSSASGGSSDKEDVKAYPNPVRPDYLGYVTIEGIPSGCIVKIMDAAGNIVKELGRTSGSETLWDVTNHQFKRVSSGVYYILASSIDSDTSYSKVGKILVVN